MVGASGKMAQRQASTREQQPEKSRGDTVKQTYADKVKAERRKAAQARIAAKKSGGEVKKTETKSAKDTSKKHPSYYQLRRQRNQLILIIRKASG